MNKRIYSLVGYLAIAMIPLYFLSHKDKVTTVFSNEGIKALLMYAPYICLSVIAFLGTRLNQTRVFFSSLFLLTLYQVGVFKSFDIFFILPELTFYKAALISLPLCFSSWLLCKESSLGGNKSLMRMFVGLAPFLSILVVSINDQDLFKLFTGLSILTYIDSYLISYTVLIVVAVFSADKKINDFKHSLVLALIPIGALAYYSVLQNSKIGSQQIYWSLCFSASSLIMLYSMFKMYWQRVYLDEMTALPNRRALDEKVEALGSHYAIAMIDVDNFKKFNDTYGHDQGDDVLKLVARTLESVLGDKVYRYGGEEFAAVFSQKHVNNSKELIEEAREKLANTKFTVRNKTTQKRNKQDRGKGGGKKVSVTFSAGVSHVNQSADTPTKVIKLADNALYKAKKKGRNCVVVAA